MLITYNLLYIYFLFAMNRIEADNITEEWCVIFDNHKEDDLYDIIINDSKLFEKMSIE